MSVFQMLLEGKSEQPAMGGKLLAWVANGCEGEVLAVVQAVVSVSMSMRVEMRRRWVGEAKRRFCFFCACV